MYQTIKVSEIPAGTPEFRFGSPELTAFHREVGAQLGRMCDYNHHGQQYIVDHGDHRTLNTLTTFHCTPSMVDILEGE